ncbi:beta-galactosidase [Cruoricaptor ignavus]|uniref:beta-galactosidase n=1 Tax=Cruoricaptor ignavus TaxID=1118202 RepID=UPI00370D0707
MAGFECTDQLNAFGHRVVLVQMSGHDRFLNLDYQNITSLGIGCVREGIRWTRAEPQPYKYEFSWAEEVMENADAHGIQVVWDICHFGFPDDLTPLHPMFARRFAHLCRAFVEFYRKKKPEGELVITPINEVSFLSWLGGDVRGTSPYCIGQGWEVKYHLMKAYIEGVEMMKDVDPGVRILSTEPLISILPASPESLESTMNAVRVNNEQFQVLEILSGNICPELRGKPEYLDIIGLNFYYDNQWVLETHEFIPWGEVPPDPRWKPLSRLTEEVFARYRRPVIISETSHPGEHRPNWLEMIGRECGKILEKNIPLYGCCIYPAIDRPDWDFTERWHKSGLWDIHSSHELKRLPNTAAIEAFKTWPSL